MKKRILCTILALTMVLSATAMTVSAKLGEIYSFDFEDSAIGQITDKSQLDKYFTPVNTDNVKTYVADSTVIHVQDSSLFKLVSSTASYGSFNTDNDVLTISKTEKTDAAYEIRYGAGALTNELPSTGDYTLTLGMKTNFSTASGAQLAFGGQFEFVCSDTDTQKLSIKYWNGTEMVTLKNADGKTLVWDFKDYAEVKFVVDRTNNSTDLYIAGELAVENVPIREGKSDFEKIRIVANKSTIGDVCIKGIQAYKNVGNKILELNKTTTGTSTGGTLKMSYASLLDKYGAKDYTLSFDMYPRIEKGTSINVGFGAYFEFVHTDDMKFKIMDRQGSASNTEVKTDVTINDYATVKIIIKDGKGNLYINDELIDGNVEYRNGYTPETFHIVLNNSMTGSVYIDNIKLSVDSEQDAAYVSGEYKANSDGAGYRLNINAFVPTASAGNTFRVFVAYFADDEQKEFLGGNFTDVVSGEVVSKYWGSSIPENAVNANLMLWNDSLAALCGTVTVEFDAPAAE